MKSVLPLLNTYTKLITFPINGKKYEIRPYLVGEEKILLMAAESRDEAEIRNAIKNLIHSCVVSEKIEIENLSSVELEFLFLEIRKISADQIITLKYEHQCDEATVTANEIQIDLDDIKLSDGISNVIILDDARKIGVKMRVPSIKDIESIQGTGKFEKGFGILVKSIESIFTEDEVFLTKDISKEDLGAWIDNLNEKQLKLVMSYIENLPRLKMDVHYNCKGCGKEDHIEIEGLTNFLM